ncbi:hypothetical protein IG631_01850 [Alternaria alternata]|nr:hypothetical protein IG631_01850 [Alternaria alternata]
MARCNAHLELRAAVAAQGTCTFPYPPTLVAELASLHLHVPVRLCTSPHHGLTQRRTPCADSSGPIIPLCLLQIQAGSCSDAVTCTPYAAVQGLFPRPELADGHVNESKRVLAASLPAVHSLLVPQSQTAPIQFGVLRVPSIR